MRLCLSPLYASCRSPALSDLTSVGFMVFKGTTASFSISRLYLLPSQVLLVEPHSKLFGLFLFLREQKLQLLHLDPPAFPQRYLGAITKLTLPVVTCLSLSPHTSIKAFIPGLRRLLTFSSPYLTITLFSSIKGTTSAMVPRATMSR